MDSKAWIKFKSRAWHYNSQINIINLKVNKVIKRNFISIKLKAAYFYYSKIHIKTIFVSKT